MRDIPPDEKTNTPARRHFGARANFDLRLGDSRDLMRGIPDASVDLILTDPPYNLGLYSTGNMKFSWRAEINNDIAEWDKFSFEPGEWKDQFSRILKPNGNIFAFCAHNLLGRWHETFDPVFDTFQFVVWHKTNPTPKMRRAGFLNSCELIACCWNKGHTWNFTRQNEMHNFIESPLCMGEERIKNPKHPTQKPVSVLSKIVAWSTNPGDIVFDPFMGVGSSGAAAIRLGRAFVGFEARADYFSAAARRLDTERESFESRLL